MEPPLVRVFILRGILVLLPFAIWIVWRAWARRTGREMGSTPYAWLFAAGALLVGASLLATGLFHQDNRQARYVPAEARADGTVAPGHFEPAQPSPPLGAPR
jgi:hypothetical protein